jgi:hypothetical protein
MGNVRQFHDFRLFGWLPSAYPPGRMEYEIVVMRWRGFMP